MGFIQSIINSSLRRTFASLSKVLKLQDTYTTILTSDLIISLIWFFAPFDGGFKTMVSTSFNSFFSIGLLIKSWCIISYLCLDKLKFNPLFNPSNASLFESTHIVVVIWFVLFLCYSVAIDGRATSLY